MCGPVSQFHQFWAACPGANHLTFLYLSFSIHKMGLVIPTFQKFCIFQESASRHFMNACAPPSGKSARPWESPWEMPRLLGKGGSLWGEVLGPGGVAPLTTDPLPHWVLYPRAQPHRSQSLSRCWSHWLPPALMALKWLPSFHQLPNCFQWSLIVPLPPSRPLQSLPRSLTQL